MHTHTQIKPENKLQETEDWGGGVRLRSVRGRSDSRRRKWKGRGRGAGHVAGQEGDRENKSQEGEEMKGGSKNKEQRKHGKMRMLESSPVSKWNNESFRQKDEEKNRRRSGGLILNHC